MLTKMKSLKDKIREQAEEKAVLEEKVEPLKSKKSKKSK